MVVTKVEVLPPSVGVAVTIIWVVRGGSGVGVSSGLVSGGGGVFVVEGVVVVRGVVRVVVGVGVVLVRGVVDVAGLVVGVVAGGAASVVWTLPAVLDKLVDVALLDVTVLDARDVREDSSRSLVTVLDSTGTSSKGGSVVPRERGKDWTGTGSKMEGEGV